MRYDQTTKRFWVGYGDGGLAAIDAQTGKQVADVKLDAHPESFQLEAKGNRIFVNVTKAGHVAVIDQEKAAVIAKWPVKEASSHFPMARDEASSRLFIGCRKPAKLLVLDTKDGHIVTTLDIVGDTDDLFFDDGLGRLEKIRLSGGVLGVGAATDGKDRGHHNQERLSHVVSVGRSLLLATGKIVVQFHHLAVFGD